MKFIELTDYHTTKKILINMNKVFTVRNTHKSTFYKTNYTIIDFGNDQYIHVTEEYDLIKEIIERM
jgi:hypothetical protein